MCTSVARHAPPPWALFSSASPAVIHYFFCVRGFCARYYSATRASNPTTPNRQNVIGKYVSKVRHPVYPVAYVALVGSGHTRKPEESPLEFFLETLSTRQQVRHAPTVRCCLLCEVLGLRNWRSPTSPSKTTVQLKEGVLYTSLSFSPWMELTLTLTLTHALTPTKYTDECLS